MDDNIIQVNDYEHPRASLNNCKDSFLKVGRGVLQPERHTHPMVNTILSNKSYILL
jgi:hypothetical protein